MASNATLLDVRKILEIPSVYLAYRNAVGGNRASSIYVSEYIRPKSGDRILDIGCGPALKLQSLIAPLCNDIVGLDDQRIVEYCRQHFDFGQFIACDIEHDPFPVQRTFDLIICADVIEHLVDPDKLLDAIRAAATPDSWIVLSTPDRDILRGKGCLRSPKRMHVREWTSAEFAIYLTSRSFVIHEHTLLPPIKFYWSTEYFQQRFLQLRAGRSFASCQMVVCKKRP